MDTNRTVYERGWFTLVFEEKRGENPSSTPEIVIHDDGKTVVATVRIVQAKTTAEEIREAIANNPKMKELGIKAMVEIKGGK